MGLENRFSKIHPKTWVFTGYGSLIISVHERRGQDVALTKGSEDLAGSGGRELASTTQVVGKGARGNGEQVLSKVRQT